MRLTFIQTPMFDRSAKGVLSDDDIRAVEERLLEDPEAGDTMAESGGARKLRVALPGRGRSGGARVIYFHHAECARLYLLLTYPKNVADNVSRAGKRQLRALLDAIKREGC